MLAHRRRVELLTELLSLFLVLVTNVRLLRSLSEKRLSLANPVGVFLSKNMYAE